MDAHQEPANLASLVEVERRFRRSVNLDRDAGSTDALDGYVVTPAVRRALSQITEGLDDEAGDRAWSLVGPYGSGKSAFAVFLADLLSGGGNPGGDAARGLLEGAERARDAAAIAAARAVDGRACSPGHPPPEVPALDGRGHLGGPEGCEAPGAENHQGAAERLNPDALPLRDLRCRRVLRGSGPDDRRQDRRGPAAHRRRGRQGAGVRGAAADPRGRLPAAGARRGGGSQRRLPVRHPHRPAPVVRSIRAPVGTVGPERVGEGPGPLRRARVSRGRRSDHPSHRRRDSSAR